MLNGSRPRREAAHTSRIRPRAGITPTLPREPEIMGNLNEKYYGSKANEPIPSRVVFPGRSEFTIPLSIISIAQLFTLTLVNN